MIEFLKKQILGNKANPQDGPQEVAIPVAAGPECYERVAPGLLVESDARISRDIESATLASKEYLDATGAYHRTVGLPRPPEDAPEPDIVEQAGKAEEEMLAHEINKWNGRIAGGHDLTFDDRKLLEQLQSRFQELMRKRSEEKGRSGAEQVPDKQVDNPSFSEQYAIPELPVPQDLPEREKAIYRKQQQDAYARQDDPELRGKVQEMKKAHQEGSEQIENTSGVRCTKVKN